MHRTGRLFCSSRTSTPKPYLQWERTNTSALRLVPPPAIAPYVIRLRLTSWCRSASGCSMSRLHWRDDQLIMHEVYVSSQVRCLCETVRENLTKCLCERVSSVRLFLSKSSAHNGVKFTQTICTCGSLARHVPA